MIADTEYRPQILSKIPPLPGVITAAMRTSVVVLAAVLATSAVTLAREEVAAGGLVASGSNGRALGACPLQHTAAEVEISGTVARVSVTQKFHNPFQEKIEAVYVFPLHQDAAVDQMTMTIGERVIDGVIRKRAEARQLYEHAKTRGRTAALLDQERLNIFSQAVANIEPGRKIEVTIRYSQTLAWRDGRYHFDFPTVVGPRYIPGGGVPSIQRGSEPGPHGEAPVINPAPVPPTRQVPDADRITPPVVEAGYRAGHDFTITVRIQAGLPIADVKSALHAIRVAHPDHDPTRALVTLADGAALPDRDFELSFATAGEGIADAILTHTDERGKFFTLVLQPPPRVTAEETLPRELVFVLDTSGSMNGFPIETSKALMRRAIEALRPADRFNLITFAGKAAVLFKEPVANTAPNRSSALRFIDTLQGAGGTEMMAAVETALAAGHDPETLRVVCFLTDGYVGNDQAILGAVRRHAGTARVFAFGIGTAVNRFLLDGMARAGRGDSFFVLRHEDAVKNADLFYQRIDAPVLTDISLDFGGLAVEEVYPSEVGDLFAAKPVVVKGRYTRAGTGKIQLRGRTAKGPFSREIEVALPEENPENPVLAAQWARAKVEHLMLQDMEGMQRGQPREEIESGITKLGLAYNLLTRFTSFVAVESRLATGADGQPRQVQVPLEMPLGVSRSGVFGDQDDFGHGWGEAGGGSGGGFGNIPATMKKRCAKADRLAQIKTHGGTPQVEDAVERALDWLDQCQNTDGSWGKSNKIELTGLALLAYLSRCETPLSEKHGEEVLKAMVYLIDAAKRGRGIMCDSTGKSRPDASHAIATYALAESAIICRQLHINVPDLDESVKRAGQAVIDALGSDGSWSAGEGGDAVLLASANLQALKACHLSGLDFKGLAKATVKALDALKSASFTDGGPVHPGPVALAYQLWARGDHPLAKNACEAIAQRGPFHWNPATAATVAADAQAMFNRGGEPWKEFNSGFLPAMIKAQQPDGSFKQAAADNDRSAHIRATCHATLALEVYFRFLPGTRRSQE
jgi:Ca-activated chloride channel homolog